MFPSLVMLTLLADSESDTAPRPTTRVLALVLRRSQLAALLGVSMATLVRMLANGLLPIAPLPWPGHPRWSRSAVALWVGGAERILIGPRI